MHRFFPVAVLISTLFISCASTDYSSIDDPLNPDREAFTQGELKTKEAVIAEAVLFEDFNDTVFIEGLSVMDKAILKDGYIAVDDAIKSNGRWLEMILPEGITSILVCSKITSDTGYVSFASDTPEGQIGVFHDVLGDWTHLKGTSGSSDIRYESAGFGGTRNPRFRLYEMYREEGYIIILANEKELGRYQAPKTLSFGNLHISSKEGGSGLIDYIAVK